MAPRYGERAHWRRLAAVRAAVSPHPPPHRGGVGSGPASAATPSLRASQQQYAPGAAPGVRRAWPGFRLHERDTFLFIDDSAIESLDGCAKGVQEAIKVEGTGNLLPMDQPFEEGWHSGTYINVIYDDEERIFKAWYCVSRTLSDKRAETEDALAYATSVDGLKWDKPILNIHGENNLVFPWLRWSTGHGVIKDPVELDPERRFKLLFMFSTHDMSWAGISQPICIAYSADGINWDVPRAWINPVIPQGTDTQLCFHWDPLIKRYVVYLRGRPNVRVITMAESEDLLEWTERELIVAPDELDPPQDHELYGMSSMAYGDFRIGFLSVFQ